MIFDCHVHLPSPGLDRVWEWAECTPNTPAAVRYLKRCGVDRCIANSMRGELARTPEEMIAGNSEVAQGARDYPMITPACLVNTDLGEEAVREIQRCHDGLGMVWIGELCGYVGGYSYDTDGFAKAMAVASDLNMVVQIHSEGTEMDHICGEFPKVTFVLAHIGDSPDECKARIGLTAKHQNLSLDICGHGYQRMGILELAVKVAGADRVLFGSDYTINDPAGVIARVQKADFDDETKGKVLGGNVVRLLLERGAT